jgi:hypothetical protein
MAVDHITWLKKQGVKITGQHILRRVNVPPFYGAVPQTSAIDWAPMDSTTEHVYQVELDERTIERFEHNQTTIERALDHANVYNSRPQSGYSGHRGRSQLDVSDFFIQNRERHLALLKENPMYKDAWKEFQSIRALLGENPHWP